MSVKEIAFYVGIILGSTLLLCSVYVFVKRQIFGLAGIVLIAFGSFLVGLSIWTSFEFSLNKDGSVTAKYSQEIKEDLGAKTAELNGSIESLKVKINDLTQDIVALKKATPSAVLSQEQVNKREVKQQLFTENSDYSVLVFYKPNQKETAKVITTAMLSVGFRSSSISTDLKEAIQQFDANTAWIVYTSKGQGKLPELKKILSSVGNVKFVYRESPYNLRSGDVQVLLF
jgi:hypothetical protein